MKDVRTVRVTSVNRLLPRLPSAFWIKAGKTFNLVEKPSAGVTAGVSLDAILADHLLALLAKANIVEYATFFVLFLVSQLIATEAALLTSEMSFVLLTVLTGVVGLDAATVTKVLFA